MQLETERLLLTPINRDDWQLFKSLHQSEDVMRYVTDTLNEEEIKERFEARMKEWDVHGNDWLTLTISLKQTGEKVGVTGFFAKWEPYQQAELGFLLDPDYQGKGYAKESALAVLDYIFNVGKYHKAIATVTEGNDASCQLLQKLGFKLEGTLRDNFKLNDKWYNDLKLGMLKDEFISATSTYR